MQCFKYVRGVAWIANELICVMFSKGRGTSIRPRHVRERERGERMACAGVCAMAAPDGGKHAYSIGACAKERVWRHVPRHGDAGGGCVRGAWGAGEGACAKHNPAEAYKTT